MSIRVPADEFERLQHDINVLSAVENIQNWQVIRRAVDLLQKSINVIKKKV